MPINLLNLNFGCGQTLNASDLTQICSKINEIIGEVNEDTVYSPLEFSVDSEGYWTINGQRVKDSQGNDVKATSGSMSIEQYSCGDNFPTDKPIGTIILKCNELYMYDGENWVSIGQSEGEGNYTHMAYAYDVQFDTDDNDYDQDSNTSEIIVSKVTGFTINPPVNRTDYRWIGICISNNIQNPGNGINSENNVSFELTEKSIINKYKWNFLDGKDGNGEENVYMRTKVNVKPTVVNNNVLNSDIGITENQNDIAENGDKTQDEFLPLVGNIYTGSQTTPQQQIARNDIEGIRWFDDQGDVTEEWPFRWQTKRKKINGVWQPFGNVVNAGTYTESAVNYIIDCTIPSIVYPNNSEVANFNPTLTFYKVIGQSTRELFSCNYAIYSIHNGNYHRLRYSSLKVNTVTISGLSFNFDEIDSIIIFIADVGGSEGFPENARPTSFYTEREICKQGREVEDGEDAIVYSLSCSPSSVSFRRNIAGDMVTSERTIYCSVIKTEGQNTPERLSNYISQGFSVFYRRLYTNNTQSEWITNYNGNSDTVYVAYNINQTHIYTNNGVNYVNAAVANPSDGSYLSGIEFALSASNNNDINKIIRTITVDIFSDGIGSKGANGYSNAQIYLYTSSSTDFSGIKPTNISDSNYKISNDVYYKFSDQQLYQKDGDNYIIINESNVSTPLKGKWKRWNRLTELEPENEGEFIYITSTIANATTEYDLINPSDWVGCIKYDKGKAYNCHKVILYTRDTNVNKPSDTYYYKFSDGFLYTKSGNSYTKQNSISVTISNKTTNWYYNFPTYNGNPCYFIQTTALGTEEYDEIVSSDWIGPDIAFQDGESITGETGKMFYSMGIWDQNINYSEYCDDMRIPIVFYDDGIWNNSLNTYGSYYYFDELYKEQYDNNFSDSTYGLYLNPRSSFFEGIEEEEKFYWKKADNFGLIFTQGIFSEFAKLGSAVISGDYMMSQNGKIELQPGYAYTMPDYTYFQSTVNGVLSDDTKVFEFNSTTDVCPGYYDSNNTDQRLLIKNTGIKFFVGPAGLNSILKITCSKVNNRQLTVMLAIGTASDHPRFFSSLGSIDNNNSTLSFDCGQDINSQNQDTVFKKYRNKWVNLYIYGYKNQTISEVNYQLSGTKVSIGKIWFDPNYNFEPNWCVDLKSGKMVAGGGNFIVNPDGTIYMKSFIQTENYIEEGDFEEFNNNFTIGSGGLSTEIKLYKLDCTKAGVYVIRSIPGDLSQNINDIRVATIIDSSKYNDVLIFNSTSSNIPIYTNNWSMSVFESSGPQINGINLNTKPLVIGQGGYIRSLQVSDTSLNNNIVNSRYISSFNNVSIGVIPI